VALGIKQATIRWAQGFSPVGKMAGAWSW